MRTPPRMTAVCGNNTRPITETNQGTSFRVSAWEAPLAASPQDYASLTHAERSWRKASVKRKPEFVSNTRASLQTHDDATKTTSQEERRNEVSPRTLQRT